MKRKIFGILIAVVLAVSLMLVPAVVSAKPVPHSHWYVDASVSATGDGSSWGTAFKTIGEAIAVAGTGDHVTVAAGTYTESVTITTNGIKLKAKGRAILDGTGLSTNGITLSLVTGVTVEGFEIRDYTRYGIWLTGGSTTNNKVKRNVVSRCCYGIFLVWASSNKVEHNVVSGSGSCGIYLGGASGNEVKDNVVSGSGSYGIYLYKATNNKVRGNVVCGCHDGIILRYGATANNEVKDNVVCDNGGQGISLPDYASDNLVKKNTAKGNACDFYWDLTGTGNLWADNKYDTYTNISPHP